MARLARVVIPEVPHHVVQRGNRRQNIFFSDKDRLDYLELFRGNSKRFDLKILAYCLMRNHVHFIVIPKNEADFSKAIGDTHRQYSRMINFREGWRGYLFQGRFLSYPMDESHLFEATRYVENNPVVSGIVRRAEDFEWSSAKAHVLKIHDPILGDEREYVSNFFGIKDWGIYLRERIELEENNKIEYYIRTGRPYAEEEKLTRWEKLFGKKLKKEKPGPKGK